MSKELNENPSTLRRRDAEKIENRDKLSFKVFLGASASRR